MNGYCNKCGQKLEGTAHRCPGDILGGQMAYPGVDYTPGYGCATPFVGPDGVTVWTEVSLGMTKRERLAADIFAQLIGRDRDSKAAAVIAVEAADTLLAELCKTR